MAVTAGSWFEVQFFVPGGAEWTLPAAFPSLPPIVLAAVLAGTPLVLFCLAVDATDATLINAETKGPFLIPLQTIDSETLRTTVTHTWDDGSTWKSTRTIGDSAFRFYDDRTAEVRYLTDAGEIAALSASLA